VPTRRTAATEPRSGCWLIGRVCISRRKGTTLRPLANCFLRCRHICSLRTTTRPGLLRNHWQRSTPARGGALYRGSALVACRDCDCTMDENRVGRCTCRDDFGEDLRREWASASVSQVVADESREDRGTCRQPGESSGYKDGVGALASEVWDTTRREECVDSGVAVVPNFEAIRLQTEGDLYGAKVSRDVAGSGKDCEYRKIAMPIRDEGPREDSVP
jgi:hypothetical protein